MNLSYTSFLVGLCCIRGGVMARSKLYILSPSKHNQNWKGQTLFSMVTSHIHELIFDIDINSSCFICILKRQTCLQPQHFEFFQNLLAHTICHLPTCPIKPMFHGIIMNIQLHKQFMCGCIFCHEATMIELMKNQSKLD